MKIYHVKLIFKGEVSIVLPDKENHQKESRILHEHKGINPQGRPNDLMRLHMYA